MIGVGGAATSMRPPDMIFWIAKRLSSPMRAVSLMTAWICRRLRMAESSSFCSSCLLRRCAREKYANRTAAPVNFLVVAPAPHRCPPCPHPRRRSWFSVATDCCHSCCSSYNLIRRRVTPHGVNLVRERRAQERWEKRTVCTVPVPTYCTV